MLSYMTFVLLDGRAPCGARRLGVSEGTLHFPLRVPFGAIWSVTTGTTADTREELMRETTTTITTTHTHARTHEKGLHTVNT